jgi:RNA polymerase sigma factor (sigma-70 family)
LAAGDRGIAEDIYQQNYRIVNGWLIKNGASANDAADIFQEAMMVLFGKAQDPGFTLTSTINTYLLAVSKHVWYKKLEQQSRNPIQLQEERDGEDGATGTWEDDVNVHHEREAHFEQLNNALDQIGEPCRSLLKAYYHQNKSMQEIAADFGYTNPENAKTQKYKCLTRLRKLFYSVQAK